MKAATWYFTVKINDILFRVARNNLYDVHPFFVTRQAVRPLVVDFMAGDHKVANILGEIVLESRFQTGCLIRQQVS